MEKPVLKTKQILELSDHLKQISEDLKHDGEIKGIAVRYSDRTTTILRNSNDQLLYREIAKKLSDFSLKESENHRNTITQEILDEDEKNLTEWGKNLQLYQPKDNAESEALEALKLEYESDKMILTSIKNLK